MGGAAGSGWGWQYSQLQWEAEAGTGGRSVDEEEQGCGNAARGADEGSLVRCQHSERSLAFWFRNSSILLFFSLWGSIERLSGRLCLIAPLCERQPASSVSSSFSSLGKGLCHSLGSFDDPCGCKMMQYDVFLMRGFFFLMRTCKENCLKTHYWGCEVKPTQVRKCQNKVGLWAIKSGSLNTMKWSLVLWSRVSLVDRTSATFSALDGWWLLGVNLKINK